MNFWCNFSNLKKNFFFGEYHCPPASSSGNPPLSRYLRFCSLRSQNRIHHQKLSATSGIAGYAHGGVSWVGHPRAETNPCMARVRGFARFARKSTHSAIRRLASAELRQIVSAWTSTRVFGFASKIGFESGYRSLNLIFLSKLFLFNLKFE